MDIKEALARRCEGFQMNEFKRVPMEPTAEMVEAAESAYMPFGDMELALRMAVLAAPAVKGELVGWQFYKHGKWWNGDILTKNQRKNIEEEGVRVRNVYAEPQFAEQQPEPGVAELAAATLSVLPDSLPTEPYQTVDRGSPHYKAGWNACRRAMLAALEKLIAAHHEAQVERRKAA